MRGEGDEDGMDKRNKSIEMNEDKEKERKGREAGDNRGKTGRKRRREGDENLQVWALLT